MPDTVAYSQPSPPGRGQGDAPKARGSEWYHNKSHICPQRKFRATFQLKPESI